MIPPKFSYYAPDSLQDALALISEHQEDGKILSGGHSLIPILKLRLSEPEVLIDIGRIDGLDQISESNGVVEIGPRVTHSELVHSDVISGRLPLLAAAASVIGDPQVRNVGTVGGNLAHADPASDLPAAMVCLNATIELQSAGGSRSVAIDDFFVDLLTTEVQPDEILTGIKIPVPDAGAGWSYAKLPNPASHYAIVGIAALISVDGGTCTSASVGVTGLGAAPGRASGVESALVGSELSDDAIAAAAQDAASGFDVLEDIHASTEYREHAARVYARRAIAEAWSRAA
ncbi:MAG: xanthine dehydrogenase family protein subunit M [Chloroflexi bacterium]|nr:xanthine dehydrogenase family protein subunit M [Chloroflexota bacterium]MCY3936825.1 xanthine dehydrogenase family protein subunit M [Chloroflexota bacterium]